MIAPAVARCERELQERLYPGGRTWVLLSRERETSVSPTEFSWWLFPLETGDLYLLLRVSAHGQLALKLTRKGRADPEGYFHYAKRVQDIQRLVMALHEMNWADVVASCRVLPGSPILQEWAELLDAVYGGTDIREAHKRVLHAQEEMQKTGDRVDWGKKTTKKAPQKKPRKSPRKKKGQLEYAPLWLPKEPR
jgi:hypothetical protein